MIKIFLSTQTKRADVAKFLLELHEILRSETFDAETDIKLISKRKFNDPEHSTPYTIIDLNYDISDLANVLMELTVDDYSETKIDKDDLNPPSLFVFGKIIESRLVYIKLKIKENKKRYILCVSFHYAKDKMSFPYAK